MTGVQTCALPISNGKASEGTPSSTKKLTSLQFTTEDIGKTFVYVVSETEGEKGKGITYDKSRYEVSIAVSDPDPVSYTHLFPCIT